MGVNDAYKQMATSGMYGKPQGLKGKYDNVRRFWEDKVTAFFIRPYLEDIRRQCLDNRRKVRILDLGCGSGDGFELLTEVLDHDASPQKVKVKALLEEEIALYTGVDLSFELLEQGREYFGDFDNVRFLKGNFIQGLGVEGEPPFDIYLANYGTLSHCRMEELEELLQRVIAHSGERAIFLGDWLGAYSYEWQNLWVEPLEKDYTIPYVTSYLYDEGERKDLNLEAFPMHVMDRSTLFSIINSVSLKTGVEIKALEVFDRSLFVGRHMETGEYNRYPQNIRSANNSLLEPQRRTDLRELKVRYHPRAGFDRINDHFSKLESIWNGLLDISEKVLAGKYQLSDFNGAQEDETNDCTKDPDKFLSLSGKALTRLMNKSHNLPIEDIRANIIEPQLAYLLRRAEMTFQEGMGMGHGFTVILEITKK